MADSSSESSELLFEYNDQYRGEFDSDNTDPETEDFQKNTGNQEPDSNAAPAPVNMEALKEAFRPTLELMEKVCTHTNSKHNLANDVSLFEKLSTSEKLFKTSQIVDIIPHDTPGARDSVWSR